MRLSRKGPPTIGFVFAGRRAIAGVAALGLEGCVEAAYPAIHHNCAPYAGRTGFPFERKHWCRGQARRESATEPTAPSALADPGLVLVRGPGRPDLQDERKGWIMSVKLTDAQLAMMSAAAQRKDRCLSRRQRSRVRLSAKSAPNSRSLVWPARSRRNLERRSGVVMTLDKVMRSN